MISGIRVRVRVRTLVGGTCDTKCPKMPLYVPLKKFFWISFYFGINVDATFLSCHLAVSLHLGIGIDASFLSCHWPPGIV